MRFLHAALTIWLFGPVGGEEALEFAISDGVAQLFIEDVGVEGGAAGIMFEGEVELVGEDRFQPGKARFGAEGEIIAADIARTVADDVRAVGARIERRRLDRDEIRSEEHTSELQSLMRISYSVFCLNKKKKTELNHTTDQCEH